jgi:RNA polymerase sigma factor (sigma-70 family)
VSVRGRDETGLEGRGLPTVKEERLVALARRGDQMAVERLLQAGSGWITAIARCYSNPRVTAEELKQIGTFELWRALERFDPGRGVRLRTFAEPSVKGAIRRAARTQHLVRMTVREANDMVRIAAVRNRLSQDLQREPSEAEVAAEVGLAPWQVSELARRAEGVLDLLELADEVVDSALEEGRETRDLYSPEEVKALVESYAELRARLNGSRPEEADAGTIARRPGTAIHLRLLDLEGALNRLPEKEFEALQRVGLDHTPTRAVAQALGIGERTVYKRYASAISWLTEYLNQPDGQPLLRSFSFALDPDPLRSLCECVQRHKDVFERLVQRAAIDSRLKQLSVAWLPAKNMCVPVIAGQSAGEAASVPLSELLAIST